MWRRWDLWEGRDYEIAGQVELSLLSDLYLVFWKEIVADKIYSDIIAGNYDPVCLAQGKLHAEMAEMTPEPADGIIPVTKEGKIINLDYAHSGPYVPIYSHFKRP